jgi:N-methylhydantoinase A
MQIAIDTGGTFTDCVYLEDGQAKVLKILSTPENPGCAVIQAIRAVAVNGSILVKHGTTVGTNALLERKGARVAFVTTAGFEDMIAIGRQARTNLYDWFATPPPCIVPKELRFGVPERTAADGTILRKPSPAELEQVAHAIRDSGAEAIAISFLFSFANPENEIAVARALQVLRLPVSASHIILPEFREYERSSTVAVNAYLRPKAGDYLQRLETGLIQFSPSARLEVMHSSGGTILAGFASEQPVRTVLSGPAGGVMGAYLTAVRSGLSKIIAFDMGGTSTDVCLVDTEEGGPRITNEAVISQMPVSVPTLDIHTIGAGGGSLARFDMAGLLHVGPESAGANPGPICYGRGVQPTVTDANLILGRLIPEHFLGGEMRLDYDRTRLQFESARSSMATVEDFAAGIVRLAESAMEKAVRVISVERGYDPREFTLVAFGGAGPLHACALAKALRIPRVLIPCSPGALSAWGILLSDAVRDYSKTVMLRTDTDPEPHFRELEAIAASELKRLNGTPVITRSLDLRYAGQGYELNVAAGPGFLERFQAAHKKRYGHAYENHPVEIVNVRVRVAVPSEDKPLVHAAMGDGDPRQALLESRSAIFDTSRWTTAIYDRDRLEAGDRWDGPAIVVEYSATTVIQPGMRAAVDQHRNIVIEVTR